MKNKLFFFADYEGLRMVLPGVSGTNTIPTSAFASYVEGNVPAAVAVLPEHIRPLCGSAGIQQCHTGDRQ